MAQAALIAGYYGFGNAGDEAILEVIVNGLRARIPDVRLTVTSGAPKETGRSLQVDAILYNDPISVLEAIDSTDLVIIGGGGLFHDTWGVAPDRLYTTNNSGIGLFAAISLYANLRGKPILVCGVGVGPLKSDLGADLTRQTCLVADSITVRDEQSQDTLHRLGVPAEKVTVVPDLAFADPPSEPASACTIVEITSGRKLRKPLIAVTARSWSVGVDQDFWERQLAAALDRVLRETGGTALFLPFQHQPETTESDSDAARRVLTKMTLSASTVLAETPLSWRDLRSVLGSADVVVGMRFHSVLFSAQMGIPVVAIAYDPKVSHLMRSLGLERFQLSLGAIDARSLTRLLLDALAMRDALSSRIAATARRLAGPAAISIEAACSLLRQDHHAPRLVEPQIAAGLAAGIRAAAAATGDQLGLADRCQQLDSQLRSALDDLSALREQLSALQEENAREIAEANAERFAAEARQSTVFAGEIKSLTAKLRQAERQAAELSAKTAAHQRQQQEAAGRERDLKAQAAALELTNRRHQEELTELRGKVSRRASVRIQRAADRFLGALQSRIPDPLRRAVRPLYLPLYRRIVLPGVLPRGERSTEPVESPPSAHEEANAPVDSRGFTVATAEESDQQRLPPALDNRRYQPLVSVVLPVWNQADFLAESVYSVLGQTYENLELIIVDDGSSEDLRPVLSLFLEDRRVRICRRLHEGLPPALNAGFRVASGELLTWTSADNAMKPQMLETLVGFLLRRPDVDMVYGNMELIDDSGAPLMDSIYRPPSQVPGKSNELHLPTTVATLPLIADNFIGACFLYRARMANILGPYDDSRLGTEDFDYWLRLAEFGTVEHLDQDQCLYRYRVHDATLSGRHAMRIGGNAQELIRHHRDRREWNSRPFQILILHDEKSRLLAATAKELGRRFSARGHVVTIVSPDEVSETNRQSALARNEKSLVLSFAQDLTDALWSASGIPDDAAILQWLDRPGEIWNTASGWIRRNGTRFLLGSVPARDQLPASIRASADLFVPAWLSIREEQRLLNLKARDHVCGLWDIPDAGAKLILYIGRVCSDLLDWGAIHNLLAVQTDATFVFIATSAEEMFDPRQALGNAENLLYLGVKPYQEWYKYLSRASVLLAPFRAAGRMEEAIFDSMVTYLTAAKPILASETVKSVGFADAPNCLFAPPEEMTASLQTALTLAPDENAADGYLRRLNLDTVADRMLAMANSDLFRRRCETAPPAETRPGRPRCLLETATLHSGGLERVVANMAFGLRDHGFEVAVVVTQRTGEVAAECEREGIPVYFIREDFEEYSRILLEFAPELLVLHFSHFGCPLAWKAGIPIVSYVHNAYLWLDDTQHREIAEADLYVSRYVAVSEWVKSYFVRRYDVAESKVDVIPNGIDTMRFEHEVSRPHSVTRAELQIHDDDVVLLNVASMFGTKAQLHAVYALQALVDQWPHLRLVFVAGDEDPGYSRTVRSAVTQLGLEDHVIFAGSSRMVSDFYRLADAFLLTSLTEGWSLAMTEAMFFGLPLILTDVGGASQIVRHNIAATVPPPYTDPLDLNMESLYKHAYDPNPSHLPALVATIRDVLSELPLWKARGRAGVDLVRRYYSKPSVAEQQVHVLTRVLWEHWERQSQLERIPSTTLKASSSRALASD